MHEFELFLFSHALTYHHVFGINERRENALDNEAYVTLHHKTTKKSPDMDF